VSPLCPAGVVAPETWILVFNRECSKSWLGRLVPGRYKHVRAYTWLPWVKAWLFYDVHLTGTTVAVVPDGDGAKIALWQFTHRADLMRIKVQGRKRAPLLGWCVPAMKHLIGLRSGALRPDALWADCLAAGGEPSFEGCDGRAKVPATGEPAQ
jgi:hypothetical protein